MSRRSLLWRDKMGYDPLPLKSNAPRGAYKVSQCGGSFAKLLATKPGNMSHPSIPGFSAVKV